MGKITNGFMTGVRVNHDVIMKELQFYLLYINIINIDFY